MIRADNWGWRHGTRKAWAVRGLDLRIEPGERVLLLGPSGAGKSTLLAGLAGLLDPEETGGDEEGSLTLGGVPARRARRQGVEEGRARTGLLLQDPLAQTVLARCGDDVAFGLENHAVPPDEIWPRVDAALDGVGFPYGRAHSTAELSGGQRQRLALAGVLALRPEWLLLDEPTAMLDPEGAAQVRAAIAAGLERSGAGCLLVEHRVEPWLDLIDRVVVLEPGAGLRASGAPGEVFAAEGDALAADGVWVPGRRPRLPEVVTTPGADQLRARKLAARRPRAAAPAVEDVDLTVRAGQAVALIGPNGAGKSTLALTLAGLVPPAGGSLEATEELAGGLGRQPVRWRAQHLVERIGTVFQEPQHQFVAQTVAAEVGGRTDLLERLRLTHLAKANPFTLSGGEQRRLSVATVLATAPAVLVLDEPTFGQDARTWAELTALLLELVAEGRALVVASHDEALVEVLVDALGADVVEL